MRLPIYQAVTFASRVFTGNSAAMYSLPDWLPYELQPITR